MSMIENSLVVIFFISQFLIPFYLLARTAWMIAPLVVYFGIEETFRYYEGMNSSKLLIFTTLTVVSLCISNCFMKFQSNGDLLNMALDLLFFTLVQVIVFIVFEWKTTTSIFGFIKNKFKKYNFLDYNLIFIESEKNNATSQSEYASTDPEAICPEISSRDFTLVEEENTSVQFECTPFDSKSTQSDFNNFDLRANGISMMFKNQGHREFSDTIAGYEYCFKDNASIDNLFNLNKGIEIEPKSIKMHYKNLKNEKRKIIKLLSTLFEIEKNWNSTEKGQTNTQKVNFFNKYIELNDGDKSFDYNDFTRLFKIKK